MKAMKYLAVLAVALFAFASASNAQVQFVGGGSSGLFLELGQAASTLFAANDVCIWSTNALADNNIAATDPRAANGVVDVQNGKAWVVWNKNGGANCGNPAAGFQVYTYLSVDSVIGDRCFFATDNTSTNGCIANYTPTQAEGNLAANLLGAAPFADSASTAVCAGANSPCIIPTTVTAAINNLRWNVAGTDVRPEDAKFASFRALTTCTTTVFRNPFGGGLTTTNGLGYNIGGAKAGIGVPIQSFYSAPTFSVIDFSLSGVADPFSGKNVPASAVTTVGAQPIIVSVGPAGTTSLGAAKDINTFTLTLFYNGVLGRATDLLGPTTNPANFMTILVREPLSGTFQTFEYSVPNSNQFHTSQELGNCNGGTGAPQTNPMNLQSANGKVLTARRRVLGTGEMVAQLQTPPAGEDRMGYWFWSAANAKNFTAANGKYLTVNGVDPILDDYSVVPTSCGGLGGAANNGIIPNVGNGNLPCVTFKGLNNGDYPIWSALRLVSAAAVPAGVTNVVAAAQTLNSTQNDFVPLSKLNVWHSHFTLPQVGVNSSANGTTINVAGDLCNSAGALAEAGGDVGGSNVLKVSNHDFCADFSNITGLINANN